MIKGTVVWIKKRSEVTNKLSQFISIFLIKHKWAKILSILYSKKIYKIEIDKLFKLTKNSEHIYGTHKVRLIKQYSDITVNRGFHILTTKGWKSFVAVGKRQDKDYFTIIGCPDPIFKKRP